MAKYKLLSVLYPNKQEYVIRDYDFMDLEKGDIVRIALTKVIVVKYVEKDYLKQIDRKYPNQETKVEEVIKRVNPIVRKSINISIDERLITKLKIKSVEDKKHMYLIAEDILRRDLN
jgi:hypothetical protein